MESNSTSTTCNENSCVIQSRMISSFGIKTLLNDRDNYEHPDTFTYPTNYEIVIVKKGKGHILFDTNMVEILDNTVYLISPGQIYKINSCELVSGYKIALNEKIVTWGQNFHRPLFYSPHIISRLSFSVILLDYDLFQNVENIILNMINEVSRFNPYREEMMNSFLKIIMIYLSRESFISNFEKATTNTNAKIVKRFFHLLNDEFKLCKSVSEFAFHLAVTPNYLSEAVKRETGYSATYHIQQRIIMEAKNIASNHSINMKTIAYNLGFEDVSHFSKFFKKYSGVNFSEYRKQGSF